MGDFLRRLKRETKVRRCESIPVVNRLWRRNSMERVIDFSGVESFSVKRQHLRRRQIFRVKISLPLGVLKARCADPDIHVDLTRSRKRPTLNAKRQMSNSEVCIEYSVLGVGRSMFSAC